jgi:signal recognition particle subunit SRP54
MFDTLSQSLQKVFRDLRGYGKLSESNIRDALREVRLALLEADVDFGVARDFIARVREACLGEAVLDSLTPGQQVIKRIHDELSTLLGQARKDMNLSARPASVLLLGLQGAGKTTTAAKLARHWREAGRRVLLAACDLKRPAAVEQLRLLAEQEGADFQGPEPGDTVVSAARRAWRRAQDQDIPIVVFDSAGRLQIDEELVKELRELKDAVRAQNSILVLDAAIGQESVHVAEAFHRDIGLTGLILTKLDGDARGGAALSVHAVTRVPILWIGVGEKPADLQPFHPERMASRILGMGDIVSLVEKAQAAIDVKEAEQMGETLRKGRFTLEDFLQQLRQMKKLGPLENLLEMLPGAGQLPPALRNGLAGGRASGEMKKTEAILLSMTRKERRNPDLLNASRRRRIARGSGTAVSDVNSMIRSFDQMRDMMKKMRKGRKSGGMPRFPM